jgi:hypothetical protein
MQSTITYLFDADDDTPLAAIRITVQTLTIKGVGDHARLVQLAGNQWRHECGLDEPPQPDPATGETPPAPEPNNEQIMLYQWYLRWAKCAAATKRVSVVHRVEEEPVPALDPALTDAWAWEQVNLATIGLDRPEGVVDLPVDLVEAWDRATDTVNPGVFGRNQLTSQAKKKTGVLSVT